MSTNRLGVERSPENDLFIVLLTAAEFIVLIIALLLKLSPFVLGVATGTIVVFMLGWIEYFRLNERIRFNIDDREEN